MHEERDRFLEIKERLRRLLQHQITNFRFVIRRTPRGEIHELFRRRLSQSGFSVNPSIHYVTISRDFFVQCLLQVSVAQWLRATDWRSRVQFQPLQCRVPAWSSCSQTFSSVTRVMRYRRNQLGE